MISPKVQFWMNLADEILPMIADGVGVQIEEFDKVGRAERGKDIFAPPLHYKLAGALALCNIWVGANYQQFALGLGVWDGRPVRDVRRMFESRPDCRAAFRAIRKVIAENLPEWKEEWEEAKKDEEHWLKFNTIRDLISREEFDARYNGRRYMDDPKALTEKPGKIMVDTRILSSTSCALTWE